MKKLLSLLLVAGLIATNEAEAQVQIATARSQSTGTSVTIRGIVTTGSELGGNIRYLQDATGGIAIYSSNSSIPPANVGLSALNPGDSIQVTGVLKQYQNLLELDPVTSLTILATNQAVPAPVVFPSAQMAAAFAEQYEGMLVQINNVDSVRTTSGQRFTTFSGNTNYRMYAGSAVGEVRINAASTGPNGLVGQPAPAGSFDITGVMSQYSSTYQLLPRQKQDISLGTTPNLVSVVKAENISTTGFTVTFKTQNAGNTVVNYGTTPTLGSTQTSATQTTSHSITLTGLTPATVYYVQVSSTNASGTSTSRVIPMITASNSSGDIKVYFNKPVAHGYATAGNQAVTLTNSIADTLAAYIDRATQTLDLTIYHWADTTILNAINRAHQRGVTVRMIYDVPGSTPGGVFVPANPSVHNLNAGIAKVGRNDGSIMHNKFVVIDANATDPNKAIVWTGSTNWSDHQLNDDPNSVIIIQDQSVAKTYQMEFNEMWGGGTNATAVFGSNKTDNTPHFFNVNGTPLEVYFSPSDNVNNRIIETVGSADNDLHYASMIVTRTDIANAIANQIRTKNIGNCSEGLVNDTTGAATTPWNIVKQEIGNRLQFNALNHIMHHKYLIVDAGAPVSDPTVLAGSHNWSTAADTRNDENTLIIHSAAIANQFYQEFAQRILDQQANVNLCFNITAVHEELQANVLQTKVYPNPASEQFTVLLGGEVAENIQVVLFDLTGKVVYNRQLQVNGAGEVVVETSQLPRGMYNLQVSSQQATQYSKIVIY
ncbi:MAG: phospholipase D-like domain-containing protein [Hymenobacteraceae bacterium]|nr:phospholipase D-like domain-containing protein [Hymenobacteraceae bacterium]MDX5395942.1 phospholipase D-like domain-containing protein [Hymenobacteraceae bacterium]MDX5512000.1 phospholipase D-like domain-containing protein [Hymenobacteraceae bacterium]